MLMHAISEYWLAIIVSSIAIWLASSLLWAVLPWHRKDYSKLINQTDVQDALGKTMPTPGLYSIPFMSTIKEMEHAEIKTMIDKGPLALITILPADTFNMGKRLSLWFLLNLAIASIIAILIEITTLGIPVDDHRHFGVVIHIAGLVTLLTYGGAYITEGIWFSRTWKVVAKYLVDALIYAVITTICFVYLA